MAAAALSRLVVKTLNEIRNICGDFDAIYVMFSGGRDSLVSLDLVLKALDNKMVQALFIDTGIGTPGLKEYVIEISKYYNVKLNIVRPEYDFFDLAVKKGFPMIKYRWCKDYLKIRPLKRFIESIKEKTNKILLITGVRADESWFKSKAFKIYDHPILNVKVYAPIFEWSSKDVRKYIEAYNLRENPLYQTYGKAYDCWCTVFKSPADFALLAINHPDFFQMFADAEAKLKSGGSALYYDGKKIYLRDIAKNPWEYLKKYPINRSCPFCKLLI